MDIKVSIDVVWHSDVSPAILTEIASNDTSMVIKSTKQDSLINKIFFTPNDWQLLEHCSVPLLLTKNMSDSPYQKIMGAVNPNKPRDGGEQLDVDIIDAALVMAELYDGKAHVCHCYEPIGKELWQGLISLNVEEKSNFNDYSDATTKHHETSLNQLLNDYSFEDENTHLVPGCPVDELPILAKKEKVDLFVMGMNNNGKYIGNIIEEVLGHIDCDLLSIRYKKRKINL